VAYTLSQFAKLDLAAPVAGDEQARCVSCSCELRENISGYRRSDGGPRCSDCYFEEMSRIIEQHPIGLPGVGVRR